MRTIEIYTFDELCYKAKKKVIERENNQIKNKCWEYINKEYFPYIVELCKKYISSDITIEIDTSFHYKRIDTKYSNPNNVLDVIGKKCVETLNDIKNRFIEDSSIPSYIKNHSD